jgi:hypothetical protein
LLVTHYLPKLGAHMATALAPVCAKSRAK